MYEIEDGIPIPRRQAKNQAYPWHTLNVDQSFMVPDGKLKSIRAQASSMAKKLGHRYLARVVDGGVRVWRIE